MKRDDDNLGLPTACAPSAEGRATITVLAVGDMEEWLRHGGSLPMEGKVAFVDFRDVDAALFETFAPSVVLSPLLAHGFDCIDLAQVLHRHGFRGRYRAMAADLPDPGMIRREIATLCPDLDFEILPIGRDRFYLTN